MPIVVHGAADPRNPAGPVTQTVSIMPATSRTVGPVTEAIRLDGMISYTRPDSAAAARAGRPAPAGAPPQPAPVFTSRRAAREAEQQAALQQAPVAQGRAERSARRFRALPVDVEADLDALKKLR